MPVTTGVCACETSVPTDRDSRMIRRIGVSYTVPGQRSRHNSGDSRLTELPALAEFRLEELVYFRPVGHAHFSAVPLQLAFEAQSQHTQQNPFGERRRDAEVGARPLATLAGADPVAIVSRRARQKLRRQLIIVHPLRRHQARTLAVGPGGDEALLAHEQAAVAAARCGTIHVGIELRIGVRRRGLLLLL